MPRAAEFQSGRPSLLEALVAVASRLGVETTVDHLLRSYVVKEAPTGRLLVAIAKDIGIDGRVLSVGWRGLSKLQKSLPAILVLRGGAALVLEAIREDSSSGRLAIVADPAAPGTLVAIDETTLGAVWDGEIVLLKRRYAPDDETQPFGLAWLFGQLLRERRIFVDIAAAAFVATIFALAPPFTFMIVIDRVLYNHSYATLTVLAAALGMMMLFETGLGYLRRLFTQIATTRIDARLNLYVLDKLITLPLDYFERNPTGRIVSKLTRLGQIRRFLTGQLFGAFLEAIPLLGIVPVLLFLQWRLAILVLALSFAIFAIVWVCLRPISRRYHKVVLAEQARGAHLVETIQGMRTIKSLAIEGQRRRDWDFLVAQTASTHHEMGLAANYPWTFSLPFERLIYSGSFLLGAYLVLEDPTIMAPGALIAFAMLSMRVAQPLIHFAHLIQDFAELRGAVEEVASVVNVPPEQDRAGTGLRLPIQGQVSFEAVRFRYSPAAPPALDGVSFEIPRGAMFGIMGRSGSGKTTVARLLQGLYGGYDGIIKIDGMDLREIDLNHLRTSIGVVLQENYLFGGSIRENIALAKPAASFSEIVRAAQLAGAEDFIERLPRGYDTLLEEGGVNLSGGQRQRLAIARALLIDPSVLILDEATSALDAESEAIINANLRRIAEGRTIICISHRLSMLVPADAILVLERGRVYDLGAHDELLQRCDVYRHLWHTQNRHVDRNTAPYAQRVLARTTAE